jgi:hypothetical protein
LLKIFRKSYKIICSSDQRTLYMKVAQNDETDPNARFVRPPRIPNIANMQPSLSGHLPDKCPEPGKHSRMDSPFLGDVQPYVRTHPTLRIVMSYFVLHLFAVYLYCFLPLFSLDRPLTPTSSPRPTQLRCPKTPLTTLPLPPSNQASPPFDHPDIAHSNFSCLH